MTLLVCSLWLGWENKVTASVSAVFPVGSRHVVLGGTKALKLSANSVTIDVEHQGFTKEIPFEFALICTVRTTGTISRYTLT